MLTLARVEPRAGFCCTFLVRFVAIVAALLALAGAQTSGPAARPISGLKAPDRPLLGAVRVGRSADVARLDPATLAPVGVRVRIPQFGAWSFSPAADRLAVGRYESPPVVRFVDVKRMVRLRTVRLAPSGSVSRIDWLRANRVVVLSSFYGGIRLLWVDPGRGRVLHRAELAGDAFVAASGGGRLALLLQARGKIATARLAVAGADGRVRIVRLPGIRIGSTAPSGTGGLFRRVVPGLAVDSAGTHAYVVGTEGVAADVSLRSLAVATHRLTAPRSLAARIGAWLVPSAEAKALNGPALEARWLGQGQVAVTGTSYRATVTKDSETQSATPLGLRIVDVRTWTQRTIDAGASGFAVADGALLAYGVRTEWGSGRSSYSGMGVAAYGADGNARFHLLANRPVGWVQVGGGRAYCWVVDQSSPVHLVILDVAAGTVERELTPRRAPTLLLGDGSFF
jgi:hypothetical protein